LKVDTFFEMDTGLGFGFLRRSTAYFRVGVRQHDVRNFYSVNLQRRSLIIILLGMIHAFWA